jgi:NRAMP (natural resistance-associated macrophage protein)-like metal ion transporter
MASNLIHRPKRWLTLWRLRFLMIFAVVGPGFITANVDNDPNGIYTYSSAGAKFGYALLWTMIPVTIALIVVQEMSARMGAVTGKGLSDLIREEYGLRPTFLMMVALIATNFGNIVGEFAGIASSLGLFHVSKWISVPLSAMFVWIMVVKGTYKSVEKIFLTASAFYVCYVIAGVMARPSWMEAAISTVKPPSFLMFGNINYLYLTISVIGTTIAPWMQFYLQASVVEKGVSARQYKASQIDVISGCVFTDVVAWFIIVACAATLYAHGHHDINSASEAAQALGPLAGKYAYLLFALGLFNASIFAASILPLSTAYSVCEGLGFESGVDKKFSEAPQFYWLYTILIIAGAVSVLPMGLETQIKVAVFSQFINGLLLPFVLVFMLLLINKTSLMGEYRNRRVFNTIAWATTVIIVGLTVSLLALTAMGKGS